MRWDGPSWHIAACRLLVQVLVHNKDTRTEATGHQEGLQPRHDAQLQERRSHTRTAGGWGFQPWAAAPGRSTPRDTER